MTALAQVVDLRGAQLNEAGWAQLKDDITDRMVADADLSATGLKVGLVLLRHLNRESGLAFPGTSRIAERIGKPGDSGQRMVRRALKELVERQHWRVVQLGGATGRGQGRTTRYAPAFTRTRESGIGNAFTRTQESVYPDSGVRFTRTQESPEPLKEPLRRTPDLSVTQSSIEGRGGEGRLPVCSNDSFDDAERQKLDLASFIARRFRLHRDDAPVYVQQWTAALGFEAARAAVHDCAGLGLDRDQLVTAMSAQLRDPGRMADETERLARQRQKEETAAAVQAQQREAQRRRHEQRYESDARYRIETDFWAAATASRTGLRQWTAWLTDVLPLVGEETLRIWHQDLAANAAASDWLPSLVARFVEHQNALGD